MQSWKSLSTKLTGARLAVGAGLLLGAGALVASPSPALAQTQLQPAALTTLVHSSNAAGSAQAPKAGASVNASSTSGASSAASSTANSSNKNATASTAAASSAQQKPVYLSDLTPVSAKVGYATLRKDQNLSGGKISAQYQGKLKVFNKGLLAHAPAELVFNISSLTGDHNIFSTYLGVDRGQAGSVIFKFYRDNEQTPFYTSPVVSSTHVQQINLDVSGVKTLRVVVNSASWTNSQTHSFLGDAKFVEVAKLPKLPSETSLDEELKSQIGLNNSSMLSQKTVHDLGLLVLLKQARTQFISAVVNDPSLTPTLDWLLSDTQALHMLLQTEPPRGNDYASFLSVLNRIYQVDPSITSSSLNKKIALATALEFSRPVSFWQNHRAVADPVERYEIYRDLARTPKALLSLLQYRDIEETRSIVSAKVTNEDLIWLRNKIETEAPHFLSDADALANITYHYLAYRPYNPYGDSVQGPNFYGDDPRLDRIIEFGGVCGAISKFDVAALKAFGVPANVIGQPGHAAVVFGRNNNHWGQYNKIVGWDQSEGGTITHFISAYQDKNLRYTGHQFTTSYNLLASAAKADRPSYDLAELYWRAARVTSDPLLKTALLEKAIKINPLYLPAHDELIMQELNSKHPDQLKLAYYASRAILDLSAYPKPAQDIAYAVKGRLSDRSLRAQLFSAIDTVYEQQKNGDKGTNTAAQQIVNSSYYQSLVKEGAGLLGTFSFDGPYALRLKGALPDTEFSLDGGKTWTPVSAPNQLLTTQQVAQISADHGIDLRLKGTNYVLHQDIKKPSKPSDLRAFPAEHFIGGLTNAMEYSLDNGATWMAVKTATPDFSQARSVLVRYSRSGSSLASVPARINFPAKQPASFTSILHQNVSVAHVSSEEASDGKVAANAVDGDYKDYWSTRYNGTDADPSITFAFNKTYTLTGFHYVPRQDGKRKGNIKKAQVFVSTDGTTWTSLGSVNWTYKNPRQAQDFKLSSPVQARYLKLAIQDADRDKSSDFGALGNIADMSFTTTAQEAVAARTEYVQQNKLERIQQMQKDLSAKLSSLKESLSALPAVSSDLGISADQAAKLSSRKSDLEQKINAYISAWTPLTQASGADAEKILSSYPEARNAYLKLSSAAQVLSSDINTANPDKPVLSASEAKQLADSQAEKQAIAQEAEAQAGQLKQDFATEFAYPADFDASDPTVRASIEKAYYNLIDQPYQVQELLASQLKNLDSILNNAKTVEARDKEAAARFASDYAHILNAKPSDLTDANWRSYESEWEQARAAYDALSTNAKNIDEDAHQVFYPVVALEGGKPKLLDPFDQYFAPFKAKAAKKVLAKTYDEVTAYLHAMPQDTAFEKGCYKQLEAGLATALQGMDSLTHTSEGDYYKVINQLITCYNQVKRQVRIENDGVSRIKQFRSRFADLLATPLDKVQSSSAKTIANTIKVWDRLPDPVKTSLAAEHQKLVSLQTVAQIPADQRANNLSVLKEEYKVLAASGSSERDQLPESLYASLGKLLSQKPSAQTLAAYQKTIDSMKSGLSDLHKQAAAYKQDVQNFLSAHKDLLSATPESFGLDKTSELAKLLQSAQTDASALESKYQHSIIELDSALLPYQARLSELKAQAVDDSQASSGSAASVGAGTTSTEGSAGQDLTKPNLQETPAPAPSEITPAVTTPPSTKVPDKQEIAEAEKAEETADKKTETGAASSSESSTPEHGVPETGSPETADPEAGTQPGVATPTKPSEGTQTGETALPGTASGAAVGEVSPDKPSTSMPIKPAEPSSAKPDVSGQPQAPGTSAQPEKPAQPGKPAASAPSAAPAAPGSTPAQTHPEKPAAAQPSTPGTTAPAPAPKPEEPAAAEPKPAQPAKPATAKPGASTAKPADKPVKPADKPQTQAPAHSASQAPAQAKPADKTLASESSQKPQQQAGDHAAHATQAPSTHHAAVAHMAPKHFAEKAAHKPAEHVATHAEKKQAPTKEGTAHQVSSTKEVRSSGSERGVLAPAATAKPSIKGVPAQDKSAAKTPQKDQGKSADKKTQSSQDSHKLAVTHKLDSNKKQSMLMMGSLGAGFIALIALIATVIWRHIRR